MFLAETNICLFFHRIMYLLPQVSSRFYGKNIVFSMSSALLRLSLRYKYRYFEMLKLCTPHKKRVYLQKSKVFENTRITFCTSKEPRVHESYTEKNRVGVIGDQNNKNGSLINREIKVEDSSQKSTKMMMPGRFEPYLHSQLHAPTFQENYPQRHHSFNSHSSSLTGRSPSVCSTCSSDFSSDSEDEDAATRWPWIEHIQDNGDLLYVNSICEQSAQKQSEEVNQRIKNIINNDNKEKRIQEKIKNVIKRSKSFSKKDKIERNGVHNENKTTQHHHHKKKHIQKDNENKQDFKSAQIETKVSDTMNLLCKNVVVRLNEKVQDNFVSLESVLGLITGLDFDPVLEDFDNDILISGFKQNANAIIVQGIIPNSPIGNCETIFIGDIILAINGNEVNHKNVNDVLASINGNVEVILTIERLVPTVQNDENKSPLCSIVSNSITQNEEKYYEAYNELCGVIYLTLSGEDDDSDSDVLFWYPESEHTQKLRNVRGVFLTLSDIMQSVTGTSIQSSVLVIDEKAVNICYDKIGDNVFLIAMPDEICSTLKLSTSMKELIFLLTLMFGDPKRSFEEEQLPATKHIISMFLEYLIVNRDEVWTGMRQLQLPTNIYVDISNVLCDAEAADYGECVDDFFPHRRLYGTIGTCLFYQDTLVCSHLSDLNVKDIIKVCKYHWLFEIAKREKLHQLVVWKEIFLSQSNQTDPSKKASETDPSDIRWFLLVVGQGKSLLCTLLEAGNVASIPEGNPGPHPYYVDTAWSILTYLIENLEFEATCHAKNNVSLPAIVKPREALNPKNSQSPRALELIKRKVPAYLIDLSLNSSPALQQPQPSMDGSLIVPNVSGSSQRRDSWSSTLSGSSIGIFNVGDTHSHKSFSMGTEVSLNSALSTKLTAGVSNTLFSFVAWKNYSGVFVCSNPNQGTDIVANDILTSFNSCCERIHNFFQSRNSKVRQLEHGILFRSVATKGAEIKKGKPNVKYWVVGRVVMRGVREEEIYICFKEGVPQNVIEMAFKMRYGCYY